MKRRVLVEEFGNIRTEVRHVSRTTSALDAFYRGAKGELVARGMSESLAMKISAKAVLRVIDQGGFR